MKLLVTGVTGFVGKHLLAELENQGEVSVLARKKVEGKDCFVGDLSDKIILKEAVRGKDVVVHVAGAMKGDMFKVNAEGTKNLIEACKENKVKKFIFVSSYDAFLDSKYGRSKMKGEEYVKNSGLDYVIFRPSVIYGGGDKKNIDNLIKLVKKFPIMPVIKTGKLQPLFVGDLVKMIIKALDPKVGNKTYFIGGRDKLNLGEIIEKISEGVLRKQFKIPIPRFILYFLKPSILKDKTGNNAEAEKDLGFNPISFEEGLKEMLRHDV